MSHPVGHHRYLNIARCHFSRKPSLSGSPRTAKRRRTLNNTCSADEGDDQDLHDESGNPPNDVYESKAPSSSSTSTCRISSINDSNTYATFASQDELNTIPKSIVESSKMEPATPRPPYSQIGIHNHVSLNLHFNNQHQQQQQPPQPSAPKPLVNPQQTSDSKLISERLIESLAQRFNDTQQQQRTSSHPHTIEYFHQGLQTEPTSTTSKPPPKLCSKPITTTTTTTTTTAINILPSRERSITTTSSNYDTSFVQPQNNEFKDDKVNSNVVRLTSAADRVLPAFHTFSELKSYLKTIGLDVELVPASNTAPSNEVPQQQQQQPRNIDPIQQRLSTNEQQHQFQARSNTINVAQTPQQPQIVMLANNDSKCNRTSSISVPPNVLTERLLEYASSTLSIRPSQLSSRPSTLSTQQQQQRRSPTKPPIVSDIANLLSVSNNPNIKEQPIVQQVTRQTLLPPPPPPPPSSSSSTSATTVYHHHLTSADKVSTMAKRDLIHDDVHLHDREVEEYMNMAAAGRSTNNNVKPPLAKPLPMQAANPLF